MFLFIAAYAVATGILAFFFKHKMYAAAVVPALFSCTCLPHFKFSLPALLFMILLAFLCSSYLKDRPGQFAFFTMCAMMYSLAAIGGGMLVAVQYYGSVKTCLGAITIYLTETAELMFAGIPESVSVNVTPEDLAQLKEIFLAAVGQTVYLIPAFLVISSMFAAFITKRTLTKALGGKKKLPELFSTPYYPPVLLAVCYMLISFLGIFFALGSDGSYYVYMNLVSVLGVIFAYVGAVEYVSVLKRPVKPRQRVVYIVTGLIVVGILPQSLLSILAYYGAYRTVTSRVRVIRITRK